MRKYARSIIIANIFMFITFFWLRLRYYFSPDMELSFIIFSFTFIILCFFTGYKYENNFMQGFKMGTFVFLSMVFLSFVYTLFGAWPYRSSGDIGLTAFPFTPLQGVFSFFTAAFGVDIIGFAAYTEFGDFGLDSFGLSISNILALPIFSLFVSLITGFGSYIASKKKRDKVSGT